MRALRDFLRLRAELIEVRSLTLTPFAALAGELIRLSTHAAPRAASTDAIRLAKERISISSASFAFSCGARRLAYWRALSSALFPVRGRTSRDSGRRPEKRNFDFV